MVVANEPRKRGPLPGLGFKSFEPVDDLVAEVPKIRSDVRQHVILGQPVHLDAATGREMGKVELDLALNVIAPFGQKRP